MPIDILKRICYNQTMEWIATQSNYISKVFNDNFLTPGSRRGHFVFADCPVNFLNIVKRLVMQNGGKGKSCVVEITRNLEWQFEQTIKPCRIESRKKLLARCLFETLFMRKMMCAKDMHEFIGDVTINDLNQGIEALCGGDYKKAVEYYKQHKTLWIHKLIDFYPRMELVVILKGTKNPYIQQAINSYLTMRSPATIKLFTDNDPLPNRRTTGGQPLQEGQHYFSIDTYNHIKSVEDFAQQN